MSLAVILELPDQKIRLDRKLESSVIKMFRRVRPDWRKEDIILQRMSVPATEEGEVAMYGGYAEEKMDMIVVKIYARENGLKVRTIKQQITTRRQK